MASNKLRIYLKAYDYTLLDESAKRIAEAAKKSGATVAGPMPLPTKIRKYTVLRSVHVNKRFKRAIRDESAQKNDRISKFYR